MHDVAVAFHLGTLGEDDLIRLPAVLFAAAEAGDAVALSLIERQAEEIATMAVTAISRLGLADSQDIKEIPVVLGGGVLEARNPLLTDAITRRLAEQRPDRRRPHRRRPPVTGAALLGLDHLGAGPAARPASAPAPHGRSQRMSSGSRRIGAMSSAPTVRRRPVRLRGGDQAETGALIERPGARQVVRHVEEEVQVVRGGAPITVSSSADATPRRLAAGTTNSRVTSAERSPGDGRIRIAWPGYRDVRRCRHPVLQDSGAAAATGPGRRASWWDTRWSRTRSAAPRRTLRDLIHRDNE